jgi:hypothetical protein
MQDAEQVALRHRVALALVGMLLLVLLVLLPIALVSVLWHVTGMPYEHVYSLSAPDTPPAPSHSRLHIELISLDPVQQLVTLRVAGHHVCPPGCTWQDQIVLFSLRTDSPAAEGLPPAATILLPNTTAQVTQTIQLPVSGQALLYPFDSYELWVGVVLQRVQPDGTVQELTPAEARGHLFLTAQNRMSLLSITGAGRSRPQSISTEDLPYEYLVAERFTVHRPIWLPVLTIMLVLLVSAAAAYAVFLRPLADLMLSAASLVVGVWGIRAVLLPGSITFTTVVDLSLAVILLFVLGAITVRTFVAAWQRNRLPLPGRVRTRAADARDSVVASPDGKARIHGHRGATGRRRARR